MDNYSYVTLLTDDSYINGIILLTESLKKVKTKYPLLVLITEDVSDPGLEMLNQLKVQYKQVDKISVSEYIQRHNDQINPQFAATWKHCWTKFHVFHQTQFDKIIFLDADIMILKNIDHLFKKPHMTAALDGEYFNVWPNWKHFNAGCLVIEPSEELFKNILEFAKSFPSQLLPSYIVADQEILNFYYNTWPDQEELHLDKYYNIFAPYVMKEDLDDLKKKCQFVHFIGRKPWAAFIKGSNEHYDEYYYELSRPYVEDKLKSLNWNKIISKVKLTVYAICKNEKKNIYQWLDCFKSADYLCVLDTGSTDGTWEILQEKTKEIPNLIIDQQIIDPWRYDTARNKSMELIPKDTSVFFMVDLDELIKDPDWAEKVRAVWNPNFDRGKYTYYRDISPTGVIQKTMQEYRVHSKKWHRWINIVHEALVNESGDKYFYEFNCIPIDIAVYHYGDHHNQKTYAALCERELEEHPDNLLMRLQLAIEYEIDNEIEKAVEHFNYLIHNCNKIDRNNILQDFEIARCFYGIGRVKLIEKKYQEAIYYFREGRIIAPHYADNYIGGAEAHQGLYQDKQAIDILEAGLELCENVFWCSICNIDFWYTYFMLGKSYFNIGERMKGFGFICYADELNTDNDDIKSVKQYVLDVFQNKIKEEDQEHQK